MLGVPVFVTDAEDPGGRVVVFPTVIVAASPAWPGAPVSPFGMAKFKMAALDVPPLVTDAGKPGGNVVVLPTVTVAGCPGGPTVRDGTNVTLRSFVPQSVII